MRQRPTMPWEHISLIYCDFFNVPMGYKLGRRCDAPAADDALCAYFFDLLLLFQYSHGF